MLARLIKKNQCSVQIHIFSVVTAKWEKVAYVEEKVAHLKTDETDN